MNKYIRLAIFLLSINAINANAQETMTQLNCDFLNRAIDGIATNNLETIIQYRVKSVQNDSTVFIEESLTPISTTEWIEQDGKSIARFTLPNIIDENYSAEYLIMSLHYGIHSCRLGYDDTDDYHFVSPTYSYEEISNVSILTTIHNNDLVLDIKPLDTAIKNYHLPTPDIDALATFIQDFDRQKLKQFIKQETSGLANFSNNNNDELKWYEIKLQVFPYTNRLVMNETSDQDYGLIFIEQLPFYNKGLRDKTLMDYTTNVAASLKSKGIDVGVINGFDAQFVFDAGTADVTISVRHDSNDLTKGNLIIAILPKESE